MEYLAYLFLILGSFFVLSGSLGVFRMKDFYDRIHPAGVIDSAGLICILIGVIFLSGFKLYSLKIILLIILSLITCSVISHATARAAYIKKIKPKDKDKNN